MTDSPTLFDAPITAGSSRQSDPWSSREAAKQVRPGKAHRAIRDHLVTIGGTGTLDDACEAVTMLRGSVSRRLSDLDEMGWIESTGAYAPGRYGTPLTIWRVTDKGRQA